jgi:Arc/MetJ family transcription regulator
VYAFTVVKRTNINLDMDLVEEAARELGTRGTTDTVHEALRDVVARSRRERLARRDFEDLTPEALDAALVDGELATCDMVRLELLYSARNATEFAEIREDLAALPDCPIGAAEWARAL